MGSVVFIIFLSCHVKYENNKNNIFILFILFESKKKWIKTDKKSSAFLVNLYIIFWTHAFRNFSTKMWAKMMH